jgi:hypothetical protein
MNTKSNAKGTRLAGLVLGLAFLLTASAGADTDSSYSFARVVEGPSTVIAPSGERNDIESHTPLFVGDRLWVPGGSRLELVLSDRGLLRVEGDAEIDFTAIAYSADTDDPATELQLRQGEIQLVVPEEVLGETLPVIATPDATIYVHEPGVFRVTVSREGWTELVVREGRAEIVGDRSSSLVHPGSLAVVEGGARSYYDVRLAGGYDSLERWGEHLTREAAYASPYVDRSLQYVAAPLAEHGGWVTIGGRHAWRPRVALTWQPYHHGHWRSSPTGLIWVSYDPWGHVTHHYGLWDYVPGYGWVWYPGRTYRTAWVHWYWSPSYVGWCPSGYYASYYGGHGRGGLTFGIYGYAGGSWGRFEHWNFTAAAHFGRRDQDRYVHSGRAMERLVSTRELGRGIITTDAGAAGRRNPREIVDLLESEVRDYRRETGRDLPDVSDYVARKPLPNDLREAIVKPKPVRRPDPPAGRRTSVVSWEYPGSPSTGRDRGTDLRDLHDRVSKSPRETPTVRPREVPSVRPREVPSVRPREIPSVRPREIPSVRPRSDDDERTLRVKPRDLGSRETPRAAAPERETSPPAQRSVSSSKPSKGSEISREAIERAKSKTKKDEKSSSATRSRRQRGN